MKTKKFSKKLNKSQIPAKDPKKRIKKPTTKTIGKKLEKIDPELFEYLQQNDKNLLDCEETDLDSGDSDNEQDSENNASEGEIDVEQSQSDEDEDDSDADIEDEDDDEDDAKSEEDSESDADSTKNEKTHKPPESLEVASDDSDFEDEEDETASHSGKVTLAMVNSWENDLKTTKHGMKPLATAVKAFHACLIRITGDANDKKEAGFRVDGSAIFNAVIRLCVTHVYPYLQKIMSLPSSSINKKMIMSSKKWSQAKNTIRTYIVDLIKLIKNVSSEDILRVLLKHFHQMTPFASCLPTITKPILKQMISLWGTSNDDTIRVIAFLCILRLATCDLSAYLHTILKKMYVSYVSNCKFISQNSVSTVNFMRKSLTELFSLNDVVSYNHAFLYIRQLAIHLRSAVITKKKDSVQAVYNWQFISSLRLWVDVLCRMHDKPQLNALIYPVVQIIIGCIKLIPTAQYLPLRFHCIQMLIKLTKETGIFIPVLPFIVEIFSISNMSAQHKKLSMKPMDFTYILRLSKSQMQEIAYKDAVIESIYECVLEYTAAESHRISFPDTVLLLQIQMKQFLKDCKNVNYTRKLKPLLEKIDDVSKFMNAERSKCGISLSDEKGITAWESNMKLKGNSLTEFHKSWLKMNEQKMIRKHTDKIQLTDHELSLPVLKKLPKKNEKKRTANEDGRMKLFDSDDESDTDIKFGVEDESEEEASKKPAKNKKKESKVNKRKLKEQGGKFAEKKKQKRENTTETETADIDDVVEDFDMSKFLS